VLLRSSKCNDPGARHRLVTRLRSHPEMRNSIVARP
jgi:hypothetical protein